MVIAGCPTYDGTRFNAVTLMQLHSLGFTIVETNASLLTRSFNELWANALNRRPGATHFLMLHADVIPGGGPKWPITMLSLMRDTGADVLSAVLPIKTHSGLTSTAVETEDIWNPRKLTIDEVGARDETWTESGLLVNTGLLLADLSKPWVERVCFTMNDRIINKDGFWTAECQPEDWGFSRQVRREGGVVWATRAVPALHLGIDRWNSWERK